MIEISLDSTISRSGIVRDRLASFRFFSLKIADRDEGGKVRGSIGPRQDNELLENVEYFLSYYFKLPLDER